MMWASFLHPAILGWRSLSALRLSGADQHLILHHVALGWIHAYQPPLVHAFLLCC